MGARLTKRNYREVGTYTIPHGRHDVQFDFPYQIQNVLVSCVSETYPVCYGELDWFSVTQLEHGFVIHADVKTDSCDITWVVV